MDSGSCKILVLNSLPNYLQKRIIQLLCEHIDYNNKQLVVNCNFPKILEYRENESLIKRLVINISLVSHQWFQIISNYLNVSVDFNFNSINNSYYYYSIIKATNVKILKIHYNHQNNYFYKFIKGNEFKLTINEINEKIKQLPNLKQLLIRNINISKVINDIDDTIDTSNNSSYSNINIEGNFKIETNNNNNNDDGDGDGNGDGNSDTTTNSITNINNFNNNSDNYQYNNNNNNRIINNDNLNFLNDIEFKGNIELLEVEINKSNSMERLMELKSKISKVFSLNVVNTLSKELLFETFKNWLPSIRQLLIVAHESPMSVFPWYSLSNNGYFKNISYFDIYGIELRLSNISTIIKSSPNIKLLSFSICFDKLLYYIVKLNESQQQQQQQQNQQKQQQLPFLQDRMIDDNDGDDDNNNIIIEKCTCNCLLFNKSNVNYKKSLNCTSGGIDIDDEKQQSYNLNFVDHQEEEEEKEIQDDLKREINKFSNDWKVLCELLKNSSIECLHLHQDCMDGLEIMQFNQLNHSSSSSKPNSIIYPDCFIQELGGSLISPINTLKKISIMGLNTPQLFKYIVDHNKTIQNYIYTESILDLGNYNHQDYSSIFESIINENQQITELKYSKAVFSLENEINMIDYEDYDADADDDSDELPYKDQVILHYKL
ncbi:hypothetical protein ACTFIW_004852 [Dictyostelium discoideum]